MHSNRDGLYYRNNYINLYEFKDERIIYIYIYRLLAMFMLKCKLGIKLCRLSYCWRYERFGVENLELDWFRSYHTGRTHTFTTPSGSSSPFALTCSVPEGSVVDPKEFIMYTEDIKETIDRFIINHHLYADDSQLLPHMKINALTEHRRRRETCVDESLRDWCSSRRLQLNPDKTELIWFGSRANLVKLRQLDVMSLNLFSIAVEPVDSVRDLGVILDSELSMRVHINKISSTCFFHLRRLRKLRLLIDTASAVRTTSRSRRLSYCPVLTTATPCSRAYLPAHLHHCSQF